MAIDFQNDFLSSQGMCAARGSNVSALSGAVARAARLLAWARRVPLAVVHTKEAYAPDLADLNAFRRLKDRVVGQPGPLGRFLIRGEHGTDFVESMAPAHGEYVLEKSAFSAFHGTPLADDLRHFGITHLILAGVTTQCCVSSTLRSAVDHGFFPLLVTDCCAAFEPADHQRSIDVIAAENHALGWTSDLRRVCSSAPQIDGNAPSRIAPALN
jgi:biuret amidohydrolase